MKERRIGRFEVSQILLDKAMDTGHGENLFAGSVPLDLQRDWIRGVVTFICWNHQFDAIDEGQTIPIYSATFQAGQTSPTWQRVSGT